MRDLDMKRRPRPVGTAGHRLSGREKRRRGERLNVLVVILVLAIFCVVIVVSNRQRTVDRPIAAR